MKHQETTAIASVLGTIMKRFALLSFACALLLSAAFPLRAQHGCADSPESPTAVLGVVGAAGALLATLRARAKARRKQER